MTLLNNQKGIAPLLAIGVGFAILASGTVTASAANNSVPGDPLYGLDAALESFQVATSLSDTSKAATHLTIAQEKLAELQALQSKGKSAEHIAKAAEKLAEHQKAAEADVVKAEADGKDVEKIVQQLQENSERQQKVLAEVLTKVPEQAQDAVQKAMEASQKGLTTAQEQQTKPQGVENKPENSSGR